MFHHWRGRGPFLFRSQDNGSSVGALCPWCSWGWHVADVKYPGSVMCMVALLGQGLLPSGCLTLFRASLEVWKFWALAWVTACMATQDKVAGEDGPKMRIHFTGRFYAVRLLHSLLCLGHGSALHPRCRCVCIQGSSQKQAKYFSWQGNGWTPHQEQSWTNTHRLALGWGLTHGMESWLGLNLPLSTEAFVQRWCTAASLKMLKIWQDFVAAGLLKRLVCYSVASTKAVAAALLVLACLLSERKPLLVAEDAIKQRRWVRLIL